MSSVVSRYGNTHVGYLFMKSAPRIVLASAALAIGAECFGNGLIDVFWNSANKGVRESIQSRKGCKKKQWPDLLKQIKRRQQASTPVDAMNESNGLRRNVA